LGDVIHFIAVQVDLVTAGAEIWPRQFLEHRGDELLDKCEDERRCEAKLTSGWL
jgi:hypothetical protein